MNSNKTNNNDKNNMITITFFIQTNPFYRLLSLLQKSDNVWILRIKNIKIQKNY